VKFDAYASSEIKSTHPPSRRISPNEVGFHRSRRFHPPARVDLVEKSTDKVDAFFWSRRRESPFAFKACRFAPHAHAFSLTPPWLTKQFPELFCFALRFPPSLKSKRKRAARALFLLSRGYKKDNYAVLAYEFELLHNRSFLVKSFAYAHGEIIYSVNCEI